MSNADVEDVQSRIARLEQQDQRLTRALDLLAGAEAAPTGKRRRDRDVLAAVIASFIGLLALVVSGYTAYVQREQLRAQVWPHLVIVTANVDPRWGWIVVNQGTGPAEVIAMRVIMDGMPATTWGDVQRAAGYTDDALITSWISRAVLPAGKETAIARPQDLAASKARFEQLLPGGNHRLRITLCYCSVLDDCWIASANGLLLDGLLDGWGTTRDDCPIAVSDRFVQ